VKNKGCCSSKHVVWLMALEKQTDLRHAQTFYSLCANKWRQRYVRLEIFRSNSDIRGVGCELMEPCSYMCQPNIIHYSHQKKNRTFLSEVISGVPRFFWHPGIVITIWLKYLILSPLGLLRLGLSQHLPHRPSYDPQNYYDFNLKYSKNGKAIPEGSRRLRLPDFKTVGIWRWQGCQS
jgi:hypothetical protein